MKEYEKKDVKIVDVAKHAKVSISTVSNVIHDKGKVNSGTKERVLKIIQELGYIPNEFAQRLKKGIKKNIDKQLTYNFGLIVYKDYNKYGSKDHSELIESLDREIRNSGYHLYFYYRCDELSENPQLFNKVVNSRNIDGLIVISSQLEGIYDQVRSRIKNIISIGESLGTENDVDCIKFDDYNAAYDAVKYLAKLGHKRIGTIADLVYYREKQKDSIRLRAYKDAVRDFNLESDESLIEGYVEHDSTDPSAGTTVANEISYKLMKNLLDKAKPLPTAVFVETAESCGGIIEAIKEKGLQIPDDISIVTMGSEILMDNVYPVITTLTYDVKEISKTVIRRLIERISNPEMKPVKIVLPYDIAIRESCKQIK
ncbi:MAG: hypothetical protein A3J83_05620 [Elusimicrobia bacterium RIFOXYA2_FULL_40_6]|nr:MAG: hypothetical protein A3J83_05620 [Elusimicrobia bacterium RIFOXYA2_FULL_40_6]